MSTSSADALLAVLLLALTLGGVAIGRTSRREDNPVRSRPPTPEEFVQSATRTRVYFYDEPGAGPLLRPDLDDDGRQKEGVEPPGSAP